MNEESAYADTDAEASERRHLPECPTITDPHGVSDIGWTCDCECQCEILRACEQRVETEFVHKAAAVFFAAQFRGYGRGHRAALKAAREAVATLYAELEANRAHDLVDGVGEALDALDALCGGVT